VHTFTYIMNQFKTKKKPKRINLIQMSNLGLNDVFDKKNII